MASLKQQLEAAGYDTSTLDENAILSKLDAAGYDVSQYKQSSALPDDVVNEPGLQAEVFPGADVIGHASRAVGKAVEAGGAGIGDLVAHPNEEGLQRAATDVQNVESGEKPENFAGKVGKAVGSAFTPDQIAIGAGLGAALGPVGEWAADLFKGWSEQAARNAIGFVKSMANKGDIADLSGIAQFVMNPVKVAGKTFQAILTKDSSPAEMLKAAEAIKAAAGSALGKVSETMDSAIADNSATINLGAIDQNLAKLQSAVERNAADLGAPVVKQYEKAISDFRRIIDNWKNEDAANLFTDLRSFKTTIGDLMGEGENVVASKLALQKVYGTLASELDAAAGSVSKGIGAAYSEANKAYMYASDAVEALTGKIKSDAVKPLLPSIKDLFTGNVLNGSPALASGLRTASNAVAPAIRGVANMIPGVGAATGIDTAASAIYNGLTGQ